MEFYVPFNGYINKLRFKLYAVTNSVKLVAGNKRRCTSQKSIQHHSICLRTLGNQIGDQRDWFTGRMSAAVLFAVEVIGY